MAGQDNKMNLKIYSINLVQYFTFGCKQAEYNMPSNSLVCIADDASHMGKYHSWVKTPTFDRVANKGLLLKCL